MGLERIFWVPSLKRCALCHGKAADDNYTAWCCRACKSLICDKCKFLRWGGDGAEHGCAEEKRRERARARDQRGVSE